MLITDGNANGIKTGKCDGIKTGNDDGVKTCFVINFSIA
jgi:hypothetical protein